MGSRDRMGKWILSGPTKKQQKQMQAMVQAAVPAYTSRMKRQAVVHGGQQKRDSALVNLSHLGTSLLKASIPPEKQGKLERSLPHILRKRGKGMINQEEEARQRPRSVGRWTRARVQDKKGLNTQEPLKASDLKSCLL